MLDNKIVHYLLSETYIKQLIIKEFYIDVNKVILLKRGIYSDIYKIIDNTKYSYILKIYRENFKTNDTLKCEIDFISFLKRNKISVLEYINSKTNKKFFTIYICGIKRYAVLMNYIEKSNILNYNNKNDIQLFANNVSKLHKISKNYNCRLEQNDKLFLIKDIIDFFSVYHKNKKSFFEVLINELFEYYYKFDIVKLTKMCIHGDIHGANFLKINEQFIFIDFDLCGYDYLVSDLSTFLLNLLKDRYDIRIWNLFIEFYLKNNKEFNKNELKHIYYFVIIKELSIIRYYIKSTKFLGIDFLNDSFMNNKINFLNFLKRRLV